MTSLHYLFPFFSNFIFPKFLVAPWYPPPITGIFGNLLPIFVKRVGHQLCWESFLSHLLIDPILYLSPFFKMCHPPRKIATTSQPIKVSIPVSTTQGKKGLCLHNSSHKKISEILPWISCHLVIISVLLVSVVLPVYYHAITVSFYCK